VDAVAASTKEFGFRQPIDVDPDDYTIVGANIKGIKPLKPKAAGPAPAAKPRRKVVYL